MAVREKTNAILSAIESGVMTSEYVLNSLLSYLSEYEVADFCESELQDFFEDGNED